MYEPPHFRQERLEAKRALIAAHPLGLLVTAGDEGLLADPVPFLLDPDPPPLGRLRGHVSRANSHWRRVVGGSEALVVFQGPDAYVSPAWYESKRRHGKVVPTWNYVIVQVHGRARAVEDRAWLAALVNDLTRWHERGRPQPWAVTDAPAAFIEAQLSGIVGIEVEVARMDGKWKVSQNRPEEDRLGVAAALREGGGDVGRAMARLVEEGT
jgi:transcriptional regulator